ncbi:hypothetical protein D9M68_587730 [compost metagenome]
MVAAVVHGIGLALERRQRVWQEHVAVAEAAESDAIPLARVGAGEAVRDILLRLGQHVDRIARRAAQVGQAQAAAIDREQHQGRIQRY